MASVTAVVATSAALTSLATVCVGLRCVSRFGILRKPSIDDYLVLVSITLSWVLAGLMIRLTQLGLGRHYKQVPSENTESILKLTWACRFIYNAALTLVKVSALFQFLRFAVARKSRTAGLVILVLVSMYGGAATIACVTACQPTAFFWDKSIKSGKCTSDLVFGIATITLNIVTDLLVILLPLHVLQDIRLSKRDKLALQVAFTISGLTCFTSAFRLYSIYLGSRSQDVPYYESHIAIWSAAELNIGISCGCIPTIRPLAQRVVSMLFTQKASSSDPSRDGNSLAHIPVLPGYIHRDLQEKSCTISSGRSEDVC